jgi:hypothetical protein
LEISATYQNVTKTAVLTLAETGIATLTLDRTSMPAGNPVTATVTLTGAAPDGTLVLIHSSSFAAVVPPALTIPAGSTKATFSIETKIVERCSIER